MIHLNRLSEPDILTQKKVEWTQKFIKSKKKRPDNSKYAHSQIKESLEAISNNKCYYCERKLYGLKSQVDHYIEVAERKDLAFDWDNLYLSCELCNNKFSNIEIPCNETIDPFKSTDIEISSHISFDGEQIIAVNNSEKGIKTIQKYKLGSERHNYLRLKKQQEFWKILEQLRKKQLSEKRKLLKHSEIEILKRFSNKSSPYSLMFKILLKPII